MPSVFAITTAANSLVLDSSRRGETQFTVTNATGRPLRARARVAPEGGAQATWFTIAGEGERDFPVDGTQQYVVQIAVPGDVPAGRHSFRLDVVDVALPDENLTQGPTIAFEVPAPLPVKKPFPSWIPIAIIAAIILLGGIIAALVVPGIVGPPTAALDPERFVGTWLSTDRTTLVSKLVISRQRNGFTVIAQTSAGKEIDVGEGVLKGNKLIASFPGVRLDGGLAEISMTANPEGTELIAQVSIRVLVSNQKPVKVLYTK
ncbi:MAG TPA: hypothetical protein VEW94_06535 [Chloroflexia bacterium]|nr:hypothetical protein [Chloroflexia bacterium]